MKQKTSSPINRSSLAFASLVFTLFLLFGCGSKSDSGSDDDGDSPPLTFALDHDWKLFGSLSEPIGYSVVKSGSSIYVGMQSEGLFYSDDGGSTWSSKTSSTPGELQNNQVVSLAVYDKLVFIGTMGGISVWDRDKNIITQGSLAHPINDLKVGGDKVYAAADSDGIEWASLSTPTSFTSVSTIFKYTLHLFIAGGALYVSGTSPTVDEEIEVFDISSGPPAHSRQINAYTDPEGEPGTASVVGPIYVDGSVILLGVNSHVSRSSDGGASFSIEKTTYGGTVSGIASDGSRLCLVKFGSDLWYSSDLGASWKSAQIPGYADYPWIIANSFYCDGAEIYIAHMKGLVVGKLQ
jgi:hypothetical protein